MPTVDLGLVVGSNGKGVPTGGSAGHILAKNSSSNYDTGWVPMSAAAAAAFGIVENGNAASQTIAAGQYVIWKGVLYTADAAIASGTTLAASGGNKNLTAVPNGGLNALNSEIYSMLSGVSFITFQTSSNISATLNLVNGFRGLLFCASAYASNAGIINIAVTNSGVVSAVAIIGASEITINTSVNNKITVSSTQWTRCFLMSTDGASIAS